ncbi:MAG: NAD-dependent epimerase/dehydratase family protein [Candidatus Aenigmarchaeota archaeon]|nr:NAD-dependent epimerase/dehydratase family protein [Candidatus Aenigmarchaeota archaeon]
MRILVTGGAGFIGSSLANSLSERGHEVTVIDNLFLGRKENIAKGVSFFPLSVTDRPKLHELFMKGGFDYVFHLAAISSAPMYVDGKAPDPADWTDVNVTGFTNILNASLASGVKKVIYASTSSVYSGNPLPYTEDQKIEPKTMYEVTLYVRELIADVFRRTHGMKLAGLRYFAVYGFNETHKGSYANLVSQFLWAMKKGQEPFIYGDGTQTRDFLFINDALEANILAMTTPMEGVFNVGTGTSYTLNELVALINETLGTDIQPLYKQNPLKNYVEHTLAGISKIKKFGFTPKVSLEQGIRLLLSEA